jgi:hypothetical protein
MLRNRRGFGCPDLREGLNSGEFAMVHRSAGVLGVAAILLFPAWTTAARAEGALAIGQTTSIAKDGVSFGSARRDTLDEAKAAAIENCKKHGSDKSKARCKVVATFRNKCVAASLDPKAGTPGFGWALAASLDEAVDQALIQCNATAGPGREDKCERDDNPICDGTARPNRAKKGE